MMVEIKKVINFFRNLIVFPAQKYFSIEDFFPGRKIIQLLYLKSTLTLWNIEKVTCIL